MTAFFHTAISIALLRVFKEYDWQLDKLVYFTPVSLRQFNSKLDALMMGYCVGGLCSVLDVDFANVLDDNEIMGKFWSIAREMNVSLHKRINEENKKFNLQLPKLEQPDRELNFHFVLSNTGFVDTKCLRDDIRIENLYTIANMNNDNRGRICANFANTIDDKICWSIMYNCFFTQTEIIEEYVGHLKYIIKKMV